MRNIVRLGMFETNSSSMHSIVIKKVDSFPETNKRIYNDFFHYSFREGEIHDTKVWFKDFENENYCRQSGRVLISTEDKLNLYLTLLARSILYNDSFSAKMDCDNFSTEFRKKIKDLNESFFNKLGVNLNVQLPEMSDEYASGSYYANMTLPYVEDSDCVFDELLKLLEDPKNLYSYLYLPESFVFLAGDEYNSAYVLKKILQKGADLDGAIVIGCLSEVE